MQQRIRANHGRTIEFEQSGLHSRSSRPSHIESSTLIHDFNRDVSLSCSITIIFTMTDSVISWCDSLSTKEDPGSLPDAMSMNMPTSSSIPAIPFASLNRQTSHSHIKVSITPLRPHPCSILRLPRHSRLTNFPTFLSSLLPLSLHSSQRTLLIRDSLSTIVLSSCHSIRSFLVPIVSCVKIKIILRFLETSSTSLLFTIHNSHLIILPELYALVD